MEIKEINNLIDSLYKILILYENVEKDNCPINVESYLNYIDRLYVKWLGFGCDEIYLTLKGLWELGETAGHKRVKSNVFHMISTLERFKNNGV